MIWFSRAARAIAVAVLGAAAAAYRWSFARRTLVYPYDSYFYLGTARSLLHDATYSFRGFPHTRFLPLYPFATAAAAVGLGVERAGRMVPPVAWAGVVAVTYLIGRRLLSEWAGLVAAVLLVAQPIGVKWAAVPMGEAPFTLALCVAVWLGLVAAQDGRPRWWIGAGLFGGLAILGRYEGAVIVPLLVVVALAHRPLARRHVLVGSALLVALPGLWLLRSVLVSAPNQSYASEFSTNVLTSASVVWDRLRYFAIDGWLNPWFAAAAWAGVVVAALRPRWRLAAALLGIWLSLFVVGHLAWYYVYERFLVPALPAAALLAGAFVVFLAEGAVTLLRAEGVPPLVAVVVAVVLAGSAVAVSATSDLHTARTLTDTHILELSDDWGGGVTRDAAANLHDVLRPGEAVATDSGALVAYYVDAPTYYLPFKEGQTVDRADIDSVGVRLLDDLRARNVRWLVVQEPAGAKDPRTALADYSLVNGGLCLWRRFATGAIGPDSHPVAVDVFEMPPCRAPG